MTQAALVNALDRHYGRRALPFIRLGELAAHGLDAGAVASVLYWMAREQADVPRAVRRCSLAALPAPTLECPSGRRWRYAGRVFELVPS